MDDRQRSCRVDRDGRRNAVCDVDRDGVAGGLISRAVPSNGFQGVRAVGIVFGVQGSRIWGAGVRGAEVVSVDFKLDAGNFDVIGGPALDSCGAGNCGAVGRSDYGNSGRGGVIRTARAEFIDA